MSAATGNPLPLSLVHVAAHVARSCAQLTALDRVTALEEINAFMAAVDLPSAERERSRRLLILACDLQAAVNSGNTWLAADAAMLTVHALPMGATIVIDRVEREPGHDLPPVYRDRLESESKTRKRPKARKRKRGAS